MQKIKHPVLATYDMLIEDLREVRRKNDAEKNENKKKKTRSNIPVLAYVIDHNNGSKSMKFQTVRYDENFQVDIKLHKFNPRFYDNDLSEEYSLEIYVHKKLVNPELFQQEFSIFLASEKHLIDFITGTIWPHIDGKAKKATQQTFRKFCSVSPPKKSIVQQRNYPRYSLRPLKIAEKK